jgi:hypothetical protein
MLKRLNLLNTFWALVLPAAADAISSSCSKDSSIAAREVYESAG